MTTRTILSVYVLRCRRRMGAEGNGFAVRGCWVYFFGLGTGQWVGGLFCFSEAMVREVMRPPPLVRSRGMPRCSAGMAPPVSPRATPPRSPAGPPKRSSPRWTTLPMRVSVGAAVARNRSGCSECWAGPRWERRRRCFIVRVSNRGTDRSLLELVPCRFQCSYRTCVQPMFRGDHVPVTSRTQRR